MSAEAQVKNRPLVGLVDGLSQARESLELNIYHHLRVMNEARLLELTWSEGGLQPTDEE